jgi:hypothetical protein
MKLCKVVSYHNTTRRHNREDHDTNISSKYTIHFTENIVEGKGESKVVPVL